MENPTTTTTARRSAPNGAGISQSGGATIVVVGIFACEVSASLWVGLQRPALGMLFVVAGISLALGWARRHRRHGEFLVGAQIAAAKALLAEGRSTAAWNAACAAANTAADRGLRNAALAVMVDVGMTRGITGRRARFSREWVRLGWSIRSSKRG